MASNEGTAKVDVLKVVLLGLQVCNLADIVTVGSSQLKIKAGFERISTLVESARTDLIA